MKQKIKVILKDIEKQGNELDKRLKEKADKNFQNAIVECKNTEEIKKALNDKKIARCNFCSVGKEGEKCAEVVEKKLSAFVRGSLHDKKEKPSGKCIICSEQAKEVVYIAKSY